MRIKLVVFIAFWMCIYSCSEDQSNSDTKSVLNSVDKSKSNKDSLSGISNQKETVKKRQSQRIEFQLKIDAHAEEFDPNTTVYVIMDNESNEVAAITGEGQIISKSNYTKYGIPSNAIQACGAEYGGLGEYYYLIKSSTGEVELYKGWSDEHSSEEGNHWAKVEDFK